MTFFKRGVFDLAEIKQPDLDIENWVEKHNALLYNKTASKNSSDSRPYSYIDLSKFPIDDYLFSQVTIMGSVALEPNGYYIKSGYEPLVNMNGDCWENALTLATHNSYRGAYNFLNHVQIPEQKKGWVLDTAPKKVFVSGDKNLPSIYVDLVVATERKHASLCKRIESRDMYKLSLGAIVKVSICSQCGNRSKTGSDYCWHLLQERRKPFKDENGILRITAEICGDARIPDSNRFVEASWVDDPAFWGAESHGLLTPHYTVPDKAAQIFSVAMRSSIQDDPLYHETFAHKLAIVREARKFYNGF